MVLSLSEVGACQVQPSGAIVTDKPGVGASPVAHCQQCEGGRPTAQNREESIGRRLSYQKDNHRDGGCASQDEQLAAVRRLREARSVGAPVMTLRGMPESGNDIPDSNCESDQRDAGQDDCHAYIPCL